MLVSCEIEMLENEGNTLDKNFIKRVTLVVFDSIALLLLFVYIAVVATLVAMNYETLLIYVGAFVLVVLLLHWTISTVFSVKEKSDKSAKMKTRD